MKLLLFATALLLPAFDTLAQPTGPVPTNAAQPKKLLAVVTTSRADAEVVARANRLTEKMARQLQLNNYQTARLRKLNQDKVGRMVEIERRADIDPKAIDEQCFGVCRDQEKELRRLLSTDQYADYYGARTDFYAYDKQFLQQPPTARTEQIAIPGQVAQPELKEATPKPVLRQGQE